MDEGRALAYTHHVHQASGWEKALDIGLIYGGTIPVGVGAVEMMAGSGIVIRAVPTAALALGLGAIAYGFYRMAENG